MFGKEYLLLNISITHVHDTCIIRPIGKHNNKMYDI